jgi:site-specific recombinase XerD
MLLESTESPRSALPEHDHADTIARFAGWVRRKFPETSTVTHYRSDVTLFVRWLNPHVLTGVRVSDVDAYCQHCQRIGQRPSTINRRLAALRTFFDWLSLELDVAFKLPVVPRRHFIRVGHKLPRDLRDSEVEALFAHVHSARDRAMFVLMLRCGLRVGEVQSLSLQDVTLPTGRDHTATLPRLRVLGKGRRERTAYLSPLAQHTLEAWLAVRPAVACDALFLNQHQRRLSVNGIQYLLGNVARQAGLPITCHRLRHTFGRHLVEAGVPVTSIQRLLGHNWLQSSEVYMHVSDPRLHADYAAAMRSIEQQLAPGGAA